MGRRLFVLSCLAALAVAVACCVGVAIALHASVPSRSYGQLAQAVVNAHADTGALSDRIDTANPSHAASVSDTVVTWYSQSGQEFTTATTSSVPTLTMFDANDFYNYSQQSSLLPLLGDAIGGTVTLVAVALLLLFLKRNMPGAGMRSARAREIGGATTGITFADVAGCGEAVVEVAEIVDILSHPERFAALGARTPRGVILAGPPGTGKTLLAKAVAGEAGVPFFAVSGSEFVEMFVGLGAARIRDVFKQARLRSPAIVFIDEIDALGKRRSGVSGHGNEEREQTLNQLLVELDGIESTEQLVVIAATNRVDTLDAALLRPGRFDRHIQVDLPDLIGRRRILEIHSHHKPLHPDVDLTVIARQTSGFSGADLANLTNEAAMLAARRDGSSISMADMESATLRVVAGPERENPLLSESEREVVAYHEMGHALVGQTLPHADPVHKVSIVSRGRALGFTMQVPDSDHVLWTRHQLTDKLAGLLGGRAAEYLVYGADAITSGAADDIEKATEIATRMVTELGMSPLGMRRFAGGEPGEPRGWSEQTAREIDGEIERLTDEAWERALAVLSERRDLLDSLAARLVETEVVEAAELAMIVARFPNRPVPESRIIALPRRTSRAAPASSSTPRTTRAAVSAPPATGRLRRTTVALLRMWGVIPIES